MKTLNVRELRNAIPHLKETLAAEGELVLVSKGEPIAVVMPYLSRRAPPKLPSLKSFRDAQPAPAAPIEAMIREERDRR